MEKSQSSHWKYLIPWRRPHLLQWKFMVGRQRRWKTNLPSRNTKGKAEQINNTTSQLTGTFHQGTSTHFTNNTYFPVSKGQGDKWQAQRSHRKYVIILRIKNRPYSPASGLTGSSLQTPLCISPLLFQPTTVSENIQILIPPTKDTTHQRPLGTWGKRCPHLETSNGTIKAYLHAPMYQRCHKSPVEGKMCGSVEKDALSDPREHPFGLSDSDSMKATLQFCKL